MSTRQKRLKINPICDMVPKMSAEAFDALKIDIQKNGQIDAIWVKDGEIIDGRHRYRACQELGLKCRINEYTGDDVETFVISVNVSRRHLSSKQKAWFVKRLLALHPEHSNGAIAAAVGVNDKTVAAVRRSVSSPEIPEFVERVGLDGKSRKVRPPSVTTAASSLITKADVEARRFLKWLEGIHPNELTDSALLVIQLQAQIDRLQSFSAAKTAT